MNRSKSRVLVVINTNASRAEAALPAISSWFTEHCCARIAATSSSEESRRELVAHGRDADLIVIGGGDGTISKAVSELLELKRPFAVLPLGTANDFARTIGVPPDPLEAADVALNGCEHRIDVGLVNDRPYLNVASVGVASKVAKGQSKELKRRWRVFAYAIALMQTARSLRPFSVTLELDRMPAWSGSVYQVSIGNGRFHGGGLTVAEHAAIDDGKLDVYLVYPGRFWQLVASILHLRFGLKKPDILKQLSATTVYLRTDRPKSVDADGELAAETPAEFRVYREALTVMVPRTLPPGPLGLLNAS
ncbi:MAG TPA: lipid kinase [Methyloceanibacter sp.]|nr:lipid kinase [Methyloceanibacter sp.]